MCEGKNTGNCDNCILFLFPFFPRRSGERRVPEVRGRDEWGRVIANKHHII